MTVSTERAVLAGGCFWGVQDLIRRYPGVISTRVGYTGGEVPNATYRNHGNHAEGIEIIFDPGVISFRKLLEFFQIHDTSTLNRQGNDRGASYRSAIFFTSDEQKQVAEDTIADVDASGIWPGKVVTEVAPAGPSGKPSPSIRIISKNIPTDTPATSSVRTGCCRTRRKPPRRWRAGHASLNGLLPVAAPRTQHHRLSKRLRCDSVAASLGAKFRRRRCAMVCWLLDWLCLRRLFMPSPARNM